MLLSLVLVRLRNVNVITYLLTAAYVYVVRKLAGDEQHVRESLADWNIPFVDLQFKDCCTVGLRSSVYRCAIHVQCFYCDGTERPTVLFSSTTEQSV